MGLATDRPACDDRQRGQVGAASGEWAAQLLDEDVSEFFPDELALILNCSRAAATQLWERSTTLLQRLPSHLGRAGGRVLDWSRARAIAAELGWPARESPGRRAGSGRGGGAAAGHRAVGHPAPRPGAQELIKADPAAADRRRSGPSATRTSRCGGSVTGWASCAPRCPTRRRQRCAPRWMRRPMR